MTTEPRHLTLDILIDRLSQEDPNKTLKIGFTNPHSYRGYYEDLAFCVAENVTVGQMLADARSAVGTIYQGWKGGDYRMEEYSQVWLVSERGDNGESLGALLLEYMLSQGQ